jgi:GT2 family glycosyltransferase
MTGAPVLDDVAVVIPTLERAAKLRRCLEAIEDGEVRPALIVVVDQSAGEETQAVTRGRRWTRRVRYQHLDERSASAARDRGLRAAALPLVAFTDDDCVPDPGWLRALVDAHQREPSPGAVTGRVLPLGDPLPGTFSVASRTDTRQRDYVGRQVPWYVGTGGNLLVETSAYERAGGFDPTLGPGTPAESAEDLALLYDLLTSGARIRYAPDAVVRHERKSRAERLTRMGSYARGVGTLMRSIAQRGDPYASVLLGRWVYDHARLFAGARRQRDEHVLLELRLQLRGLIDGLRG